MARSKRSRKPARRSRARKPKRKAKWARTTTVTRTVKMVRRNPHGRWSTGRFWQRRNVAGMRMEYPIQIPGGIGFLYNDAELRTFLAEAKRLDKARRRGTGW